MIAVPGKDTGVLVIGRAGAGVEPLLRAVRARGVPLRVTAIDDPAIARLYERRLVLVRPDGQVAWRCDNCAARADEIIGRICGHGLVAGEAFGGIGRA